MAARVRSVVQQLRDSGWEGRGSAAFFNQMDGEVFPAVQRLEAALQDAQRVTLQIRQVIQTAEEEAAQPFRGKITGSLVANAALSNTSFERGEGESGPPPAPAPPDQAASGDGSGVHGAAGPPTGADWETHRTMGLAALGARILRGYDITASHMEHFLGNSGEPLRVDVDRMLGDMPEFQQFAEQQYRQEVLGEVSRQIAANYNGQPMQFEVSTGWRSDYYPDKGKYTDWYHGVGGFSYSHTAVVTVTPDPAGGDPSVTVQYRVHMYDRYNWDAGKSVTLPSSGVGWIDDHTIAGDYISDTQMGRLHAAGIAHEYELFGSSSSHFVTYLYDPATGVQAMPSSNREQER